MKPTENQIIRAVLTITAFPPEYMPKLTPREMLCLLKITQKQTSKVELIAFLSRFYPTFNPSQLASMVFSITKILEKSKLIKKLYSADKIENTYLPERRVSYKLTKQGEMVCNKWYELLNSESEQLTLNEG